MVIKVINKKVVFIHTAPNFDTSGMIEVEAIPNPENNGMIAELFWDDGFYYEYHNPPEDVEEEVQEEAEDTVQVPEKISNLQLRSQLIIQGFNLGLIEQTFNQISDATQRGIAVTAWEYATNFYRNHSMIVTMGNMLGLTPAQVDEIFIKASKL